MKPTWLVWKRNVPLAKLNRAFVAITTTTHVSPIPTLVRIVLGLLSTTHIHGAMNSKAFAGATTKTTASDNSINNKATMATVVLAVVDAMAKPIVVAVPFKKLHFDIS